MLQIRLLGEFSIEIDKRQLTGFSSPRLQSLLAYLLLHRTAPQDRRHLAFLLWPDTSESQARTNLRNLFHLLRNALPNADAYLRSDSLTLQWHPEAPEFSLDTIDFELAAAQSTIQSLEHAAELYRGDLLPNCYQDWITSERERLSHKHTTALERLAALAEQHGDLTNAIAHTQSLLRKDPLRESAYRTLMRQHSANRDRASALRAYHACSTALRNELGTDPSPETQAAYKKLIEAPTPQDQAAVPALPTASGRTPPLIGRTDVLETIQTIWRQVQTGNSRCVLLSGEPGIGKTRLADAWSDQARQTNAVVARAQCFASESALAYAPVVTWLRNDNIRRHLHKLDDVWRFEITRLLPEVGLHSNNMPGPMTEAWQRQRLFEALARATLSAGDPLILLLDDAQWCDRDTLEWLHYLLRTYKQSALMVLITLRSDEAPSGHPFFSLVYDLHRANLLTEIELQPLDKVHTAALASYVADRELTSDRLAHLFVETEGNPLFIIETVRMAAISDGTVSVVSPTLRAVINRRLDQLSTIALDLAGVAAMIGREFSLSLLRAAHMSASDVAEHALIQGLDELWQRRIVREQGMTNYDFTHDRIREAVLSRLSETRRRFWHLRIAKAMEAVHYDELDSVSGQTAWHYAQAGHYEQAATYYARAAGVALRLFANEEAIAHVENGLAALSQLPETHQSRAQHELAMQLMAGAALFATRYRTPEVSKAYSRALQLSRTIGNAEQRFSALRGSWESINYLVDLVRSRALAQEMLQVAESSGNLRFMLEANYAAGVTAFFQGDFLPARTHLECGVALCEAGGGASENFLHGPDPGVGCHMRLAWVLQLLGYQDQARLHSDKAINRAHAITHPYSQGFAHTLAALLYMSRFEPLDAHQQSRQAEEIGLQHGFQLWQRTGNTVRIWAATLLTPGASWHDWINIEERRKGEAEIKGIGVWFTLSYALLAAAHGRSGDPLRGLQVLQRTYAWMHQKPELFWEPSLLRLEGELMQLAGLPHTEVLTKLNASLRLARQRSARLLELRTALALARIDRGTNTQRDLRTSIRWFDEGFDTPTLREARATLTALEQKSADPQNVYETPVSLC